MRIFLAGASGVIGRRVTTSLIAQGHQVIGATRRASHVLARLGAEVSVVDVYDRAALAAAVAAARPDVVMHQLTDLSDGNRAANARVREEGTRNLVDAALAAGVRRVVAQSIAWTYEPGTQPATEDVPLDLESDADRIGTVQAVHTLEETVQQAPEWVVLRYGLFYGPETWYAPGALMAQQAAAGRLPATADVTSFVHVDDAAAAAVVAMEWPNGFVNICDDDPAPGHDWTPAFCEAVGAPRPSRSDAPRTPWARGADNGHARKELGWTPRWTSWREGFAELG
ncbi:NAD-dependent epimerase/dehydratase family protein [Kibdelosporangium phytohabitans]|uniref:dTDP-glucose 4,6-dehydratase n=1 Tax=Kibdelosporangium phytohabitans TaxID=860235 RepID=A0A0N9HU73_9PSEU|nr:NAD(P)-dependent oxidoreductase [Kibdelosporangium phytohabitans]ALG08732.1 dTDP-glucose 4,6-dehydratase [Kibdelosporangium phytohabitans]MBE1470153.1 nucleoside-diphosphate-sugar epimerase [Kibdelosporangium phytohabitans]